MEYTMIRFENIDLIFGDKTILSDFSLEIAQGEKVVLTGRSGVGKSSLFALLLGFVRPRNGRVLFGGTVVDERTVWDLRRKVAFVDQDVSIGDCKVSDWFTFVAGIKANRSLDFREERILELMDVFELNRDLLDKDISDLSGGERQRVAIIVSVLLDRNVFLLDEVTSALDANLKKKTADFFIAHRDWTVVSISHDTVWQDNPRVKVRDLGEDSWRQ